MGSKKNKEADVTIVGSYKTIGTSAFNNSVEPNLMVTINGEVAEFLYTEDMVDAFAEERRREGLSVEIIYK